MLYIELEGSPYNVIVSLLEWGINFEDEVPPGIDSDPERLLRAIRLGRTLDSDFLPITTDDAKLLRWLHRKWAKAGYYVESN